MCDRETYALCVDDQWLNWCMGCVAELGVKGGFFATTYTGGGPLCHAWLGRDNAELRRIAWEMEWANA